MSTHSDFNDAERIEIESVNEDADLGRVVRVMWIDSGLAAPNRWQHISEMPTNVETVESVGIWMGENEHVVMIGSTRDKENSNWLGVQLIWKPSIVRKEWLSEQIDAAA